MNWKTYLKKKGARVGAIVVAVVLVLALIAGALGGKAGFLTNLDGIVRAPLQKAATVTAQWLESIYGYIYKYDQLQAENEQLRTQLAEAQAQAREGQEAIAENERYRDLLGFTQRHTDFELEPANVVSYGASNWSSTLTLSKGSDSGIEVGDCVMNESGALVGQVIETGSTWATVRTVIDVDMSVGGYVSGSGATAMVLGDFTLMQQGCARFGYLAEGMSIFAGDTVLTSGEGGAFPAGLVVGTITDVRTEAGGQQTYGVITPACDLGMDAGQVRQLYLLYTSRHGDTSGWTLSVQQFVDFLCQEVLPDARFADQLSGVDTSQLQSARTVIDAVASGRSYTAAELANLFQGLSSQLDRGTMELLFLYYASVYSSDASWTMSMQELFDYLQNDLLTDARFASFLTDDMRAQITDAQTMLTDAVTQLRGSNYSRLVLTTTLPGESDETSAFIAQLMQDLDAVTTGDYYLIGNSAMVYEMENSFDSELLLITLLTAASIFLVVVFTFRSLVIPALLVLIVQCGVFITVTVVGLQGLEIYYLALLIVECILMGATIDYGILYTSYYRETRETMSVRDALIAAYRGSIHTVLTSGSIMVLVTAVVGKFFGNPTIEQICRTISIGAFSAIILILLFLPGMLALLDRWVLPRDLRRRLYPPKAPKAPKAPKPPKAARASWP